MGPPDESTDGVTEGRVAADRAADRRIAVAFAVVLVVEVVLGFLADAGAFPLWVWLVASVGAVLVAGVVFGLLQGRAEAPNASRRHDR